MIHGDLEPLLQPSTARHRHHLRLCNILSECTPSSTRGLISCWQARNPVARPAVAQPHELEHGGEISGAVSRLAVCDDEPHRNPKSVPKPTLAGPANSSDARAFSAHKRGHPYLYLYSLVASLYPSRVLDDSGHICMTRNSIVCRYSSMNRFRKQKRCSLAEALFLYVNILERSLGLRCN